MTSILDLAEDFMRLENALIIEWSHHAGRAADVLTGGIPLVDGDSAIDYVVDGLPVQERVRLLRLATANGYQRQWRRK